MAAQLDCFSQLLPVTPLHMLSPAVHNLCYCTSHLANRFTLHATCCLLAVQTGKYLPGDETSKGVTPTATVQDFAAAVEWILQRLAPQ